MFRNKTAWFSSSVPKACQNFWLSESGCLASWRTADYLFSDDATCPDTSSQSLSACEKRQSVKSVLLGHYVLPPLPVQDEVRRVVGRFIWECEDDLDRTSSHQAEDDGSDSQLTSDISQVSSSDAPEPEAVEGSDLEDASTGYVEMSSLPKYTGDLCEFHPGGVQCSSCKALT